MSQEPRPLTMNDQRIIRKLALIQHACPSDGSVSDHYATAEALIRDAAGQGAELIVTQELFASPYFPQVEDETCFDLAEPIPGPTSNKLCELAKSLGVAIAGSLFERRTPGVYHNTFIVIDGHGEIISRYRKMHIPDDPGFFEKFYFTPGDAPSNELATEEADFGWRSVPVDGINVGTLVCWDQWYPEAARLTALRGAELLLYPTAIAHCADEDDDERARQIDAWQTMQRSHAIANGVFVAAINRVGVEGNLTFWGRSFIVDPGGRVIAEASGNDAQVLIAECDFSLIESTRRIWPFLRDRRVDAYGDLTKRFVD